MHIDEKEIETHPFAPFVYDGAKILFLGTFPPKPEKWSMEFFYPNKINDMWRIMGIIFHKDKDFFIEGSTGAFDCERIRSFLVDNRIAMYDTAYKVYREKGNASDKYLHIIEPVDVKKMLLQHESIDVVIATGEKAALVVATQFGVTVPKVGAHVEVSTGKKIVKMYRMPSTSRAYPMSIDQKARIYRKMLEENGYVV